MKTERGTDVPTSNLLYHLNLLKLLTICTEGKNVNTEMRCHSLLPLDEIVKITTHAECIPEVGGVDHTHNRQWAHTVIYYVHIKTCTLYMYMYVHTILSSLLHIVCTVYVLYMCMWASTCTCILSSLSFFFFLLSPFLPTLPLISHYLLYSCFLFLIAGQAVLC